MNGAATALKGDPSRQSPASLCRGRAQAAPHAGLPLARSRCTRTHHPQPPARTPTGRQAVPEGWQSPGPLTRLQTCLAAQGP